MNYSTLEKEICAWAIDQEDVRALVVIGSRARKDHPAYEWSDLDLMLFVADPKRYATDFSWLAQFGELWLHVGKYTGTGDPEWLVLFEGGFKVDLLLAQVTGSLQEMLFGPKYLFVTRRGVRVLLNKLGDSEIAATEWTRRPTWLQPDEPTFSAVINQFWLAAYRATTVLLGGELWRAKMIIDQELRFLLLRLLEWQAKAVKGSEYDTWHDGRFLAEWIDPLYKKKLPGTFAPYDEEETSRALLEIIDLGSKLAQEIAQNWNYHYPATNTARVHDWIVMSLKH